MRVSDPFENRKGDLRVGVSGTLGELAQLVSELGASKPVSITYEAEAFARDVAPKLAKATASAAEALHKAGLSRDPARESRKRVSRAPKIASEPVASAADAFSTQIAEAVAAALDARDAAQAPAAQPKPARKPRAGAVPKGTAAGPGSKRAAAAANKFDAQAVKVAEAK